MKPYGDYAQLLKSLCLVYLTDRFYDPQDEGRVLYNGPLIHYDWETQHK